VEPPVHVQVQQPPHGVRVAALQRAVQLLHHCLAARRAGVATDALVASQLDRRGERAV
jgi:hypothetical protein